MDDIHFPLSLFFVFSTNGRNTNIQTRFNSYICTRKNIFIKKLTQRKIRRWRKVVEGVAEVLPVSPFCTFTKFCYDISYSIYHIIILMSPTGFIEKWFLNNVFSHFLLETICQKNKTLVEMLRQVVCPVLLDSLIISLCS